MQYKQYREETMTGQELKVYFRKGKAIKYAWPGLYPVHYIAYDGEAICPACVTKERKLIMRSTAEQDRSGWHIEGMQVNWEDTNLTCANCDKKIECACGE
jgi:hypothetical protein